MKRDRQLKILELIGQKEIRTQEELCNELKNLGYNATQATVSRDVKELHLQKVPCKVGTCYGVVQEVPQEDVQRKEKYSKVLHQVLVSAVPAGNIGVVKTLSGTANAAGAALEAMNMEHIIGTLAGDDTLLVLFATERLAHEFCVHVNERYIDRE